MRKIRLFVDAHVFDGIPQGTLHFLSRLYSRLLDDSRFEIFVGSLDRSLAQRYIGGDNFTHISYRSHSRLRRLLFTIPSALRKHKIDYAHFQYISPLARPCKYIVTIHDLLFLEYPQHFPLLYRAEKSILFWISAKRAHLVTSVSEYSKRSVNKFFNIPLDSILLTPNSVNPVESTVVPVEGLEGKRFVLYVSRIEPRKNQALLLSIWRECALYKQGIYLVLVGDTGIRDVELDRLEELLTPGERSCYIRLNGLPSGNVIWLYKNCTLFVYPSSAEGFGIPPLEAAYHGAQVLCSNKSAMADFDFFGDALFSPDNREEFKQKLLRALEVRHSPGDELITQEIREEILRRYNPHKIASDFASKIVELYTADSKGAKAKRVAVVGSAGVPARYGGFETLTEYLTLYLAKRVSMTIYCSSKSSQERPQEYNGAHLEYINLNANGVESIPYDIISLFKAARSCDTILILGVSGALILPLFRLLYPGKRLVVNIDGKEYERSKWSLPVKLFLKLSERVAVKFCHTVIADNEVIKSYVLQKYGVEAIYIPYGGDQAVREPLSEDFSQDLSFPSKYAFSVCRIEPENNLHIILEAFCNIDYPLVIVGNWKSSSYGTELWERYSGYSHLRLLNPIYNINTLNGLRSNCSIYLHGHSAGGTNPALVEAMHCALAVLAFDCDYNRATTEGRALYFRDSDQLQSLVKNTTPGELLSLGVNLASFAHLKYIWRDICEDYFNII